MARSKCATANATSRQIERLRKGDAALRCYALKRWAEMWREWRGVEWGLTTVFEWP
jgi:hypothetical protein